MMLNFCYGVWDVPDSHKELVPLTAFSSVEGPVQISYEPHNEVFRKFPFLWQSIPFIPLPPFWYSQ